MDVLWYFTAKRGKGALEEPFWPRFLTKAWNHMKGRTQEIQLPVLGEVQGPTEHMKATAKKGKRQSELHKFGTHLFHRQKPEVQDDASDRMIGKEK
ncbi:hypothetical protein EYF80_056619 [Liparis tanakae]|uniref:Uncharacterized protein n=1 Tax=Liparis tanakae TaxID=230148 RepID=A0A4Z2EWD5_9TELE|nr:hypothetical protein EYF80_056619 [Liparis tanakae]